MGIEPEGPGAAPQFNWAASNFDFSSGPPSGALPNPPVNLNDRAYPPSVFSVTIGADGVSDVFLVGNVVNSFLRNPAAVFRVYFTPISLANATQIATDSGRTAAFNLAVLVGQVDGPARGGNTTFTSSRFFGQDGWFWATAVTPYATQSRPVGPIRAPSAVNATNLNFPPVVSGQGLAKTSTTVNGVAVSAITASAIVPSVSQGVTAIFVTDPGAGYVPPVNVVITGGLLSSGVTATATAVLNSNGGISQIVMGSTGSFYGSVPTITFTAFSGPTFTAHAVAVLGPGSDFAGFQLYLTNYLGGTQVEGPYVSAASVAPGYQIQGTFNLIPDGAHTTTFTFVSISPLGRRLLAGSPTATLIV